MIEQARRFRVEVKKARVREKQAGKNERIKTDTEVTKEKTK